MPESAARPATTDTLAPVIRLHPIRSVVVSGDLAFSERAMTVLSELGPVAFAVAPLSAPGDIASLLQEERGEVVVLDATACEAAARRVIATLADIAPRIGVVVVCHHCTEAARDLKALPKWGWTQDLRAGVELAYHEGNPHCPRALTSLRRRSAWQRMAGPLLGR